MSRERRRSGRTTARATSQLPGIGCAASPCGLVLTDQFPDQLLLFAIQLRRPEGLLRTHGPRSDLRRCGLWKIGEGRRRFGGRRRLGELLNEVGGLGCLACDDAVTYDELRGGQADLNGHLLETGGGGVG